MAKARWLTSTRNQGALRLLALPTLAPTEKRLMPRALTVPTRRPYAELSVARWMLFVSLLFIAPLLGPCACTQDTNRTPTPTSLTDGSNATSPTTATTGTTAVGNPTESSASNDDSAPGPHSTSGSAVATSTEGAPSEPAIPSAGGPGSSSESLAGLSSAGESSAEVTNSTYAWVPIEDLPRLKEMPDPLTMFDGTKVTTTAQWRERRREMIQILEDYEYGHMPPAPDNLTAEVTTASETITTRDGQSATYQMLRLSFGPDQSLGFDLGLFLPTVTADVASPFPVLVSLTSSANQNSLGSASAALARGYAVATVPYQQLGADSPDYASTAFFPAYPEYDWRDFSAWAWGLSRAVDYLVTNPTLDANKIALTGVSRLGQAVLLAGAFDERVALSAPVAGGMAFRYSGKEMGDNLGQGITEIVDQNTYWFGPNFEEFRNRTEFLPCDQHWLLALTAPRLFIMSNSLSDEYGRAYAAVQTYVHAKPVYDLLDAPQNVGLHFRPGGHGMNSEDWSAVLDFSDQYLLGKAGSRRFDELPPADQTP